MLGSVFGSVVGGAVAAWLVLPCLCCCSCACVGLALCWCFLCVLRFCLGVCFVVGFVFV